MPSRFVTKVVRSRSRWRITEESFVTASGVYCGWEQILEANDWEQHHGKVWSPRRSRPGLGFLLAGRRVAVCGDSREARRSLPRNTTFHQRMREAPESDLLRPKRKMRVDPTVPDVDSVTPALSEEPFTIYAQAKKPTARTATPNRQLSRSPLDILRVHVIRPRMECRPPPLVDTIHRPICVHRCDQGCNVNGVLA